MPKLVDATALRWGPTLVTRAYLGPVLVWPSGEITPVDPIAYDVFVSPGGSDTAAGTAGAPFATLARALAVATAGQTIGQARGATYPGGGAGRQGSANLKVLARGSGAPPVNDGGEIIPAVVWEAYPTSSVISNLITNGDVERTANDSRNFYALGWHAYSAGSSVITNDTVVRHGGAQSSKMTISGGSCQLDVTTNQALPAGASVTWSFWTKAQDAGTSLSYSVSRSGGTWLQANGTWATTQAKIQLPHADTEWKSTQVTVTNPAQGTYKFFLQRHASTNGVFWTDDWSAIPTAVLPSSPNTYRVAAASAYGALYRGTTFMRRSAAGDTDRLPDGQWAQSSGYLYVRTDDAPPGAVRASKAGYAVRFLNATAPVVKGLDFTSWRLRAIDVQSTPGALVEDVTTLLIGDQSAANGAIYVYLSDDAVIRRVGQYDTNTDGINVLNSRRSLVEDHRVTMAFGIAADCIQYDANTGDYRATGAPVNRRFYYDQRNSPSPKGGLITFMDGGLFEDGRTFSGHFGVNVLGSGNTTSRCVSSHHLHNSDGQGFGGLGNSEVRGSNRVEDCIAYLCDQGWATKSGAETDTTIVRTTLADCTTALYVDSTNVTGTLVEESILWAANRTGPLVEVITNLPKTQVTFRRSILGPVIPGVPLVRWNGVAYNTLAEFTAAGGQATSCSSADPLFVGGSSDGDRGFDAYQLSAGSPALTMGATGGRIGANPAHLNPGNRPLGASSLTPTAPPPAASGSYPATYPETY